MKHVKKINKLGVAVMLLLSHVFFTYQHAYMLEDGAFIVGTSASYANPETGLIVDGGTNLAIGDAAAQSITVSTALVERSGGQTFVTIGLGGASNIQNPRIMIQNSSGVDAYHNVGTTQTGTSFMDGDSVMHLRFEMVDPHVLISPIIYVTPMGRDVQFFIRLNMASATPGTGIFLSEMVQAVTAEAMTLAPSATEVTVVETQPETSSETLIVEGIEAEQDESVADESEPQRAPVDLGEISLVGVVGLRIHQVTEHE
ncbi:MAG: hypothetical protein FWG67_04065 [Defluviitaleaceae bacterium]|nr:hypothetical protein [Defluviitaleaceae bacterium]